MTVTHARLCTGILRVSAWGHINIMKYTGIMIVLANAIAVPLAAHLHGWNRLLALPAGLSIGCSLAILVAVRLPMLKHLFPVLSTEIDFREFTKRPDLFLALIKNMQVALNPINREQLPLWACLPPKSGSVGPTLATWAMELDP